MKIKRAYDAPEPEDGHRILVDRVWPRGRSKVILKLDEWDKNVAPTRETRETFGHVPEKYPAFRKTYRAELDANPLAQALADKVKAWLAEKTVTLVYGARDEKYNQAVVLREWLLEKLGAKS